MAIVSCYLVRGFFFDVFHPVICTGFQQQSSRKKTAFLGGVNESGFASVIAGIDCAAVRLLEN